MFGLNGWLSPATGPIELHNEMGTLFHLNVINTILHRVESKKTTGATPAKLFNRLKNDFGK
jgi:hypothetical protein